MDNELEAQHVDEEAAASRILRKVDMRLVPMLSLLYLVSFIDRSNSTSCPIHTTMYYLAVVAEYPSSR